MTRHDGPQGRDEDGTQGPLDGGWAFEALEAALFARATMYPDFRLRAAVFLGDDKHRLGPVAEDAYIVGEEERAQIAAAFHATFSEGRGVVATEGGDGEVLAGCRTVEAKTAAESWDFAARDLLERLSESGAVREPLKAYRALDFLRVEIVQEDMFTDLVERAFSGEGFEERVVPEDEPGHA